MDWHQESYDLDSIAGEIQQIMPEEYLPRPYPFYRDAAFWIITVLVVPYVVLFTRMLWSLRHAGIQWWVPLLALVIYAPVVIQYWVAWDSYRWFIPKRGPMIALFLVGSWYFYLELRSEWLMRVKQAQHLRELGLRE